MSDLLSLVRPEILELESYRSARGEVLGYDLIQLDANESPTPPFGARMDLSLNRYPEPQPFLLKKKLADLYGVNDEQLLITRGMDEGIDLLIRTFCKPYQDKIVVTPPTFGFYEVAARINGVGIVRSFLNAESGFMPDWQALNEMDGAKLIFLCNPNNPTGSVISIDQIEALCIAQRNRAIIVVDEAYIEFADIVSATRLLGQCDNLVVLRTLSKAHALAGARIGTVIASSLIISFLKKIMPPYPLSSLSIQAALDALSPIGLQISKKRILDVQKDREALYLRLQKLPNLVAIYPSAANFILIQVANADLCYQSLKNQGILVRDRSFDVPDSLRITVGSPLENELLLSALGLVATLPSTPRQASFRRQTAETDVFVALTLDERGEAKINTGIGFFDHMLMQITKHSGISMFIEALGDLHIDAHHTVEDVAITFGFALKEALGSKKGITRYGFVLPMDEALAEVSIDLSGRGFCQFNGVLPTTMLGDFPTEMVVHFFQSLASQLGAAIHLTVKGENTHHMVESCFKSFGRALKQAITQNGQQLPSTKGVL